MKGHGSSDSYLVVSRIGLILARMVQATQRNYIVILCHPLMRSHRFIAIVRTQLLAAAIARNLLLASTTTRSLLLASTIAHNLLLAATIARSHLLAAAAIMRLLLVATIAQKLMLAAGIARSHLSHQYRQDSPCCRYQNSGPPPPRMPSCREQQSILDDGSE